MKRLLILIMIVLFMASAADAKLTPAQAYKRTSGNFSLPFAGTSAARDLVPSGVWTKRDGDFWYDTASNTWFYYEASSWNAWTGGGGTTLTGAYNYGGAGVGRTIISNTGAVVMTKNDTGTENVLEINATPSAGADGDGILITSGSNATGVGIQFANSGSGSDIAGSGDTWTIAADGSLVCVTLAPTGATMFVTDVTFNATDTGKDVEWDDSSETMHFLDNAVLGLGGATTAVGDITFVHDGTNLLIEAATQDNTPILLGSTNAVDFSIYGNTNTKIATFNSGEATLSLNDYDILLQDNDVLAFGDSDDITLTGTTGTLTIGSLLTDETATIDIGADTAGIDVEMYGATTGALVLWDASEDELFVDGVADIKLSQTSQLEFIDDTDGGIAWSIDNVTDDILKVTPELTTDISAIHLGDATNTSDLNLFGKTASTVTFDASADMLTFDAYDITLGDTDILGFGDAAGEGTIASDATGLNITTGTNKAINFLRSTTGTINYGATGTGVDVVFNGETAGDYCWWDQSGDQWYFGVDATGVDVTFYGDTTLINMKWDESADILSFTGTNSAIEFRGATVDANETTLATVEPTASNVLTLADDTGSLGYTPGGSTTKDATDAAIPLTHSVVIGTSDATSSWSLADGSPGQVLTIVIGTDGGAATLTPASTTGDGWATMVFTNDGEGATFMFVDATVGWQILGTFGISTNPLITGE